MNSKRQTLLLAAAAVTIFNFQSCSKYEDNDGLSLKSKTGRLTGDWEVVKINGQNPETYLSNQLLGGYTGSSYYSFSIDNLKMEWEFEKDGDFEQAINGDISLSFYGSSISYPLNYSFDGEWEWEDNKETIEVEVSGSSEEFEIKKLTNSELKIEDENGVEYEFEKNS